MIYLATWTMQVGAAWLMTIYDPSPLMVGLVQTALALPFFLFSLPAGMITDRMDRRRMLLMLQAFNLSTSLVLVVMLVTGTLGPWSLLALTFLYGTGLAMGIPASQAVMADVVPLRDLPLAITLNSISFNAGRSVGPAIAGLVFSLAQPVFLFVGNAAAYAVALMAFRRLPPTTKRNAPEPFWRGVLLTFTYSAGSPVLRVLMLRGFMFMACASALWALLPLIVSKEAGGGAGTFGLLIGCLGAGAVLGGAILPRLRRRYSNEGLAVRATLAYAVAMLATAVVGQAWMLYVALLVGGVGWLLFNTLVFALVQMSVPATLRGRCIALYLVVLQGGMATGGAIWGVVAQKLALNGALLIATALIVFSCLLGLLFPIKNEE